MMSIPLVGGAHYCGGVHYCGAGGGGYYGGAGGFDVTGGVGDQVIMILIISQMANFIKVIILVMVLFSLHQ